MPLLLKSILKRPTLLMALAACSLMLTASNAQSAGKPAKSHGARATQGSYFYQQRPEAMAFADEIAARHNLDREQLRLLIGQAKMLPSVQKLMRPAPAGFIKNWRVYRSRFVDEAHIRAGADFWRANEANLTRAEQDYGVPPEIIVGIIGVETLYGRNMGSFRVLDALATLAFDFPKTSGRDRSAYFRHELEQLVSTRPQTGIDPATMQGSYAGAMGLSQFMPSSWVKYAVDFDGDGVIDLRNSQADAIGSVANYFKSFHWQAGMPACYPVRFDPLRVNMELLLAPDILPTFTIERLAANGVLLDDEARQPAGLLALVELQNGGSPPTYVAGSENFYVITRYNWSAYYALAVIELGQAVKAAREQAMREQTAGNDENTPPAPPPALCYTGGN